MCLASGIFLASLDIKSTLKSNETDCSLFHLVDQLVQTNVKCNGNGDPVKSLLLPLHVIIEVIETSISGFIEIVSLNVPRKPRFYVGRIANSLLINEQKVTIKNIRRIADRGPLKDREYLIDDRFERKDNFRKPTVLVVRFPIDIFRLEPNRIQLESGLSQMLELRVQSSIHSASFASHGESHRFFVAPILFFIAADHLTDGVSRRKDCRDTRDERLKIKNEIPPAITALTADSARKAKDHWQDDGNTEHQTGQAQHTSFLKVRHRFPLKPFTGRKRSHFSRPLQSQLVGRAA